jgi:CheY-like chemotaxis protein
MYSSILLKRLGFDVLPVENGLEVLKLIKITEPTLVMLDLRMPVMDSITTLRLIKEDKRTREIPVVIVTAFSDKENIQECEKIGCSGVITKPINIERMHEVLQECVYSPQGFKRRHIRASFNDKIAVLHNGTAHELYAVNISEGGMYVTSKNPFPMGSELKVTLHLDGEKTLTLDTSVVYSKSLYGDLFKNPPGMALQFKNLTNDESLILRNQVRKLIAADILDSQEEVVIE